MKVLFVTSLYAPHVGGIETMISELSAEYKKRGIVVSVLTKKWPQELAEDAVINGVSVYRVLSARSCEEFVGLVRSVAYRSPELKADIIHVVGMRRPLPAIALLLSHVWSVPVIATVAGGEVPHEDDPDTLAVWEDGRDVVSFVFSESDLVTAVSNSTSNDFLKLEIPHRKLITQYAGIDLDFIESCPVLDLGKSYILSLRRLVPSKGINILIDAFSLIHAYFTEIHLVIAGDGPERSVLEEQVRDLGLQDVVEFIGTVSLEQGIGLLKNAACTVVPSISEGGGLVNVEAQAAGCPVVASRVGGIPEYVEDGVSGLLFESGNKVDLAEKIRTVLEDKELRRQLIDGGRVHAARFDWRVLADSYLSEYQTLCGAPVAKHPESWPPLIRELLAELENNPL
jgi:glycosyltransferase involved in cell wall biosynthesis